MIVACWNIAWAHRDDERGRTMIASLLFHRPELICIAEGHTDTLDGPWHGIASDADYGYTIKRGRRKVALWSRQPWHDVDPVGSPDLPFGRFVSGLTQTSLGVIRVIGVCVPWFAAHVKGGRRDSENWAEHDAYLRGLRGVLSAAGDDLPTVLIGDFNQRIPRKGAPRASHELLLTALGSRFHVWTSGELQDLGRQVVCHVGGTSDLACQSVAGVPRVSGARQLSDHDGLVARVERSCR